MDALVLCGKTLSAELPEELKQLVSTLRTYAARRQPLAVTAPLLLPYGASTRPSEPEHFDALYLQLTTMEDDGGWTSPYLISRHRAFAERLSGAKQHALSSFTPAHTPGCTYPSLHRLRLLSDAAAATTDAPMKDASDPADPAGPPTGTGGGRPPPRTAASRSQCTAAAARRAASSSCRRQTVRCSRRGPSC